MHRLGGTTCPLRATGREVGWRHRDSAGAAGDDNRDLHRSPDAHNLADGNTILECRPETPVGNAREYSMGKLRRVGAGYARRGSFRRPGSINHNVDKCCKAGLHNGGERRLEVDIDSRVQKPSRSIHFACTEHRSASQPSLV